MKSYCKRVGIPLLILTLLVSVMAPLITLAEDPPPSYETDDWTEFNKLEVADDLHDASQILSIKYSQGLGNTRQGQDRADYVLSLGYDRLGRAEAGEYAGVFRQ